MTQLDIIRILCIKFGKLDACPNWRFIKRYNLMRQITKLLDEFFDMNIFDQADILSSILIHFHRASPSVINNGIFEDLYITDASLEIKFINYAYELDNNGTISYIPSRRTFEIDMIANPKKSDGYKFSYAEFDNLPRNLSSIWNEELAPAVECRFYTIIRSLADMINYAGSYSNIEFVND